MLFEAKQAVRLTFFMSFCSLYGKRIGDEGCKALAAALQTNTTLKTLE
jgi:PIN domain nuclease of toxin-antitoxin system